LRQRLARLPAGFARLFDGIDDVAVQHQLQAFVVGVAAAALPAEQFFALIGCLTGGEPGDLGLARFSERLARRSPRCAGFGKRFARGQFEQAHALVLGIQAHFGL
jgi:hypothetical protein